MNATSIDGGEPLFTDKKFLAGEDVTINYISLPLPTGEEYYITVSACNALGCGPPSNPLTISKTVRPTHLSVPCMESRSRMQWE